MQSEDKRKNQHGAGEWQQEGDMEREKGKLTEVRMQTDRRQLAAIVPVSTDVCLQHQHPWKSMLSSV